jgi:Zn-dependent protease with chaperone function
MFLARGIAVSLTVFVLLYIALSLVISGGWNFHRRCTRQFSIARSARVLFLLRIFPLLASALITLAFTVPSFWLLEPRSSGESIGRTPVTLGLCCLMFLAAGLVRAISAQSRSSRVLAEWLRGAVRFETDDAFLPVFRTVKHGPGLVVAGIRAPMVLVSDAAVAVLNRSELYMALKHEIAHAHSRDNLKKLLVKFSPFPGMEALETAWSEAAEIAADDSAASTFADALDLAAALIKLSRLSLPQACAELTTGLCGSAASLNTRVERLFAWNEIRGQQTDGNRSRYILPLLFAASVCTAITYGAMLAGLHSVTEWLVR